MKPKEISWNKKLHAADVRDAMQEACVDCYGDDEQISGLTTMVDQELAFPFQGQVLGETVHVVGTSAPLHDPRGIDLVVVHKDKQYAIAAHSVEIPKPLPEGHLYLAAYLDWKSKQ